MRRVLSIDGGGIKGMYPASFLAGLEENLERPIGSYFDLIVGTSTGGIIALGLGLGKTACELETFYKELGTAVFPPKGRRSRMIRRVFKPKYDTLPLRSSLETAFGETRLGDSQTRLVIPSCNLEDGSVHLYKTAHHPRFISDHKVAVVNVALATTAAPTFFPAHESADGIPLIDGGVWANNPIAVAAVEAVTILGWPCDEVEILSISCTSSPLNARWGRKRWLGLNFWALKIIDVFSTAQSSGAMGMAQHLIGKDSVVRIDHVAPPDRFEIDSIEQLEVLRGLGRKCARQELDKLRSRFFQTPAEDFVPFHGRRSIGTYGDAAIASDASI